MAGFRRIAGSFLIVLVLYMTYALAAVPLIEPPVDPRKKQQAEDVVGPSQPGIERRLRELEGLFPPNSWQLNNPKIIESGQVKLLLREYRNLGNGQIEIQPCSMVQLPAGVAPDDPQARQRAVILDAPDGAVLQFDKPIELRRAEVGRLISGRLRGTVTIRSDGRSTGTEDDLRILTQDIELSESEVWTDAAVDFRFGPNYGHGRQMRMHLAQGDPSKKSGLGPNIGGLESFELHQVDRLHLEPRKGKPGAAKTLVPGPLAKGMSGDAPIEVSCRGPFFFDMQRRAATFRDRVDLLRIDPNGPSDQLSCDELTIYFEPRTDRAPPKPAPDGQPNLADLEPRRLEARGNPVALSGKTQQVEGRGGRLRYDLSTQQIQFEGTPEAWLRQGINEIHSPNFAYLPGPPGKLGQAEAKGPGWLRAEMRNIEPRQQPSPPPQQTRGPQQVEAVWAGQLRVQPEGQAQKISLTGGARLRLPEMGQLDARQIDFWVHQLAQPGATGSRYVPDRMQAEGDVRIDSPQLNGVLERMDVEFVPPPTPAHAAALPQSGGQLTRLYRTSMQLPAEQPGAAALAARPAPPQSFPVVRLPDAEPAGGLPAGPSFPGAGLPGQGFAPATVPAPQVAAPPAAPAVPQRFHVEGRRLRARVVLTEPQAELVELNVEENVRLQQVQGQTLEEKPLLVTGDHLQATEPSRPTGTITVVGRPAHFDWHGLGLSGLNINLNRGANRLWVDGPGNMDVPMNNRFRLPGGPLDQPSRAGGGTDASAPGAAALLPAASGTLHVRWHEGMNFAGQTAVFQNMVSAEAPDRHLETETLEVRFREPVRFDQNQSRQQPEVEQLTCRGGVWMESTSTANDGQRATLERTEFRQINLNLIDGSTTAAGPGWLSRVGRGSAMLPPTGAAQPPPGARVWSMGQPPGAPQDPNALTALLIRFQGHAAGNIQRREMTFYDRVQTCFGPVQTWDNTPDVDHPERLGPRGATLLCEEMQIVEMPNPLDGRSSVELEARRNVIVESQTYTARGAQVKYAQGKDMLILEGDGRTDARLYREPSPADPRPGEVSAQRIWFWPATRRVQVEGARSLDLNQFPRK